MMGKTAIDPVWKFLNADGESMSLKKYPVNQVLATRQPLRDFTVGIYRPDKADQVWVLVNADPVSDHKGNIQQVVVTFMDITDRKRTERELQESESNYRRLAENSPDMIYRMSLPDGKYQYVSSAATAIFGYPPEAWYDNPLLISEIIHADWHPFFKDQWNRLLKGDVPPTYEYQIVHKDGSIRWLNQRNVLVSGEDGRPVAIEGIVTDITERKRAEEALRESEIKFRTLADFSPTAISILRGEHFLYVNSEWENLTGYSKDEARSLNPLLLVHPDMRELASKRAADRVKGEQSPPRYEMKGITKSGGVKWLDYSATVIEYDGEPAILAVANDITDRKQAQEEREKLINELQEAIKEIKTLRGILPLCSYCKKIRDDKGYWEQVDVYIYKHLQADISHSLCPDCAKEHYPDLELFDD
jgi:PAS domain S-box-containing protein